MSFKFDLLSLPRLKQGNLLEYGYTLTSFVRHHAPCACLCSEKRQSLLFSTHLFGKGASQIKVHCHPPRSTPRIARRFAAPNDSPFYSTRFLRLGGRAPTRRERHCHPPRSTPNDSHCYSTRFLRLGERAPSISDLQYLQYLQEKRKPRRS